MLWIEITVIACVRTYTSTCSPVYIPMRSLYTHNYNMYRADAAGGVCEIYVVLTSIKRKKRQKLLSIISVERCLI
jgi:hypothetical protein